MSAGVIYVLTNPSFPKYVKIGYADDYEKRIAQLNRSECLPFAFRAYCVYEVDGRLQDKVVHNLIDKLNPDLRAVETFDGKPRVREFFNMSAEDAYDMFDSIAKLSGTQDKLRLIAPTADDCQDEKTADEMQNADKPVYTEEEHLLHSSEYTKQLYETLKRKVLALENVDIEPKKLYIAFKTTTNICDVEIQRRKLKITVNMQNGKLKDPLGITKDVSNTGHWGNGDYEVSLFDSDMLDDVMKLIMQSYEDKKK